MAKGVLLSKSSAKRTELVVRRVEDAIRNRMPRRKRPYEILDTPLRPFTLEQTLYPLGEAKAVLIDDEDGCIELNEIIVFDLVDIMAPQVDPDSPDNSPTIRQQADVGTCGWAQLTGRVSQDPEHPEESDTFPVYNIVSLGGFCCEGSSSSSESESSSSESESSEGESKSEEDSDSLGSDKNPAVVPAPWAVGGYTSLYTMESPIVPFEDFVFDVRVPLRSSTVDFDWRFPTLCEANSIRAWVSCDQPVAFGCRVEGRRVHLRPSKWRPWQHVTIQIRLLGVRRGFGAVRLQPRNKKQFEANKRFWRGIFPGAGRP